ncbi:hypothetical protein Lal_00028742 [Lupinus albus]|nr:hypothetical protein Lal_00028742 [Lupinus albus]
MPMPWDKSVLPRIGARDIISARDCESARACSAWTIAAIRSKCLLLKSCCELSNFSTDIIIPLLGTGKHLSSGVRIKQPIILFCLIVCHHMIWQ